MAMERGVPDDLPILLGEDGQHPVEIRLPTPGTDEVRPRHVVPEELAILRGQAAKEIQERSLVCRYQRTQDDRRAVPQGDLFRELPERHDTPPDQERGRPVVLEAEYTLPDLSVRDKEWLPAAPAWNMEVAGRCGLSTV